LILGGEHGLVEAEGDGDIGDGLVVVEIRRRPLASESARWTTSLAAVSRSHRRRLLRVLRVLVVAVSAAPCACLDPGLGAVVGGM
jgi:hypothetical protein